MRQFYTEHADIPPDTPTIDERVPRMRILRDNLGRLAIRRVYVNSEAVIVATTTDSGQAMTLTFDV